MGGGIELLYTLKKALSRNVVSFPIGDECKINVKEACFFESADHGFIYYHLKLYDSFVQWLHPNFCYSLIILPSIELLTLVTNDTEVEPQ